ncbi:hypothetical protein EMMF5_002738 [Cystobasidiomycetes sp. EMM_F5]
MKQSTLQTATTTDRNKRVLDDASGHVARKSARRKAGTAGQPIELDDAGVIDLSAADDDTEDTTATKADVLDSQSFESQSVTNVDSLDPLASTSVLPAVSEHSGPSALQPNRINPPSFNLSDVFTDVKPQVILKDPDLDLLFFKKLNSWHDDKNAEMDVPIVSLGVWGCDETGASQSTYKIRPRPIPAVLDELRQRVEAETNAKYNFCLVNFYENGKDSISWHSDDESFLGPLPCIASLSLGSNRDFQMKHKTDKSAKVEKWSLESGYGKVLLSCLVAAAEPWL